MTQPRGEVRRRRRKKRKKKMHKNQKRDRWKKSKGRWVREAKRQVSWRGEWKVRKRRSSKGGGSEEGRLQPV